MDYDAGNRDDTSPGAVVLRTGSFNFKTQEMNVVVLAGSAGKQDYIKCCSGHKYESRLCKLRRLFSTTAKLFEAQHTGSSLPLSEFL